MAKAPSPLEKRVVRLEKKLKNMEDCCASVEKWIKAEVKWSKEVTKMLRAVDWAKLVAAFPGSGGGANPPKDPPDYP